jgi:hypothetical protein
METLAKTVLIGRGEYGPVFCSIKFDNGKLSISGVEGPTRNGDAKGSCGQILDSFKIKDYAEGWDHALLVRFLETWQRWHLNDMRAGCEHQRAEGWVTGKEHPDGLLCEPCPTCGYKYGSAWLKEDVPIEVVKFLAALPDSQVTPAWV